MKVIVAGTRHFKDYELMKGILDRYLKHFHKPVTEIVSGGQVSEDEKTGEKWGADYLGEQYAKERGIPVKKMNADWKRLGKKAGPVRNSEMAKYADACICFWDGESYGTIDMFRKAKKGNLLTFIFNYNNYKSQIK